MFHRLLVAGLVLALLDAPACAQSALRLARIGGIPDQAVGGEILRAVYGRLGIPVEFVEAPAARALLLSSSGEIDGEVHRVAAVARQHPTLIRVEPAINYIEPSAFTAGLSFDVRGWASLAAYRIGIIRGVGSSEAGTKGMPDVQRVNDLSTLVRMLAADRFEVMVTDWFSGEIMVRQLGFADRIRALTPPLERIYIYHYLHRRHEALAPRVGAVIAAMEGSGDLERLRAGLIRQMLSDAGPT